MSKPIRFEITDPTTDFHCFRMTLTPRSLEEGQHIEIMLHASALVDLIHEASIALSEWQRQTTVYLLEQKTGWKEEELRKAGLIS